MVLSDVPLIIDAIDVLLHFFISSVEQHNIVPYIFCTIYVQAIIHMHRGIHQCDRKDAEN